MKRPNLDNIELLSGFFRAVKEVCLCKEGGLVWGGVPCSMQVFLSCPTHRRSPENQYWGDTQSPHVQRSNLLASRYVLLALIAHALRVFWCVEQPSTSLLPHYPRMKAALEVCGPSFHTRFWMGLYGHWSAKPSKVFGTWFQPY